MSLYLGGAFGLVGWCVYIMDVCLCVGRWVGWVCVCGLCVRVRMYMGWMGRQRHAKKNPHYTYKHTPPARTARHDRLADHRVGKRGGGDGGAAVGGDGGGVLLRGVRGVGGGCLE